MPPFAPGPGHGVVVDEGGRPKIDRRKRLLCVCIELVCARVQHAAVTELQETRGPSRREPKRKGNTVWPASSAQHATARRAPRTCANLMHPGGPHRGSRWRRRGGRSFGPRRRAHPAHWFVLVHRPHFPRFLQGQESRANETRVLRFVTSRTGRTRSCDQAGGHSAWAAEGLENQAVVVGVDAAHGVLVKRTADLSLR